MHIAPYFRASGTCAHIIKTGENMDCKEEFKLESKSNASSERVCLAPSRTKMTSFVARRMKRYYEAKTCLFEAFGEKGNFAPKIGRGSNELRIERRLQPDIWC